MVYLDKKSFDSITFVFWQNIWSFERIKATISLYRFQISRFVLNQRPFPTLFALHPSRPTPPAPSLSPLLPPLTSTPSTHHPLPLSPFSHHLTVSTVTGQFPPWWDSFRSSETACAVMGRFPLKWDRCCCQWTIFSSKELRTFLSKRAHTAVSMTYIGFVRFASIVRTFSQTAQHSFPKRSNFHAQKHSPEDDLFVVTTNRQYDSDPVPSAERRIGQLNSFSLSISLTRYWWGKQSNRPTMTISSAISLWEADWLLGRPCW